MTTSVTLLPNVEALVSAFLSDQAEVTALVEDRVYTALLKGVEFPCIRVTQFADEKVTQRPLWVVTAQLQIDGFGGTKSQAWAAANTAQGVMAARLEGVHDDGVVTHVTFGPMSDVPDRDYEPNRPHFEFVAFVTAHPLPMPQGS